MSNSAEVVTARHGDASLPTSYSDADLAFIAKLLKTFTVSLAVLVIGVIASSQVGTPGFLGIAVVLSVLVLFVATIWLALRVYSVLGAMVVLALLLVTSLLTALTPLAPFAVLGKLFILLSVRDRASKILKTHLALADSAKAPLAADADTKQGAVNTRFAWERWLFGTVIAILVGSVAYSAYLSILEAGQ